MRHLTLALIAATLVAPAQAAPSSKPNDAAALAKVHNLARCAVTRRPDKIRDLLRLDYTSKAYADRLWWEAQRQWNCLDAGALRFGNVVFAGALAEQLVERESRLAARLAEAGSPALQPVVARSEADAMAFCTVRAEPEKTSLLLATAPGSPDEKRVIATLGPVLGKCLRAGAKGTFNAAGIRSLLALAAWRLLDNRALYASQAR